MISVVEPAAVRLVLPRPDEAPRPVPSHVEFLSPRHCPHRAASAPSISPVAVDSAARQRMKATGTAATPDPQAESRHAPGVSRAAKGADYSKSSNTNLS